MGADGEVFGVLGGGAVARGARGVVVEAVSCEVMGWVPPWWRPRAAAFVHIRSKARDSRKLHLAVDEQTSDVVACALTSKRARDASRVASLVGQIERPIASAKADAAYDTGDV